MTPTVYIFRTSSDHNNPIGVGISQVLRHSPIENPDINFLKYLESNHPEAFAQGHWQRLADSDSLPQSPVEAWEWV